MSRRDDPFAGKDAMFCLILSIRVTGKGSDLDLVTRFVLFMRQTPRLCEDSVGNGIITGRNVSSERSVSSFFA